jgi:predicted SAM-dependent methyltransferase
MLGLPRAGLGLDEFLVKLNLGCSDQLLEGYVNVDQFIPWNLGGNDTFQRLDLSITPWDWGTSTIAEIRAHDIIEHLPDKIATMNECWRVLEPGGLLDIFVPTTEGRGAWQDPTHVSYWNRNSFLYYTDGVPERERFKDAYGIVARFQVVSDEEKLYPGNVTKLRIILMAVK